MLLPARQGTTRPEAERSNEMSDPIRLVRPFRLAKAGRMIDSLAASGGSTSAAAGTPLTTSRPPMPVLPDLGYRPFDIDIDIDNDIDDSEAKDTDCLASCVS
jgi:hypothetical protein